MLGNEYQSCSISELAFPRPYITALSVAETDVFVAQVAVTAGVHQLPAQFHVSMLSYRMTGCADIETHVNKNSSSNFIRSFINNYQQKIF
jgi:hypothetical protein